MERVKGLNKTNNDLYRHDGVLLCGAVKQNGEWCRMLALENGRCKWHGGLAVPGTNAGEKRALYSGVYASGLSEEEKEIYTDLPVGDLTDEIKHCQIQLRRLRTAQRVYEIAVENKGDDEAAETALMELIEEESHEGLKGGSKLIVDYKRLLRRKTDFKAEIRKEQKLLSELNKTQAELNMKGFGAKTSVQVNVDLANCTDAELDRLEDIALRMSADPSEKEYKPNAV